jgi:hypothetical protein
MQSPFLLITPWLINNTPHHTLLAFTSSSMHSWQTSKYSGFNKAFRANPKFVSAEFDQERYLSHYLLATTTYRSAQESVHTGHYHIP